MSGDYKKHIENYKESIRNLGKEGIDIVIYNFMPVLDWVRTDLAYKLENGCECLHYDPVRFAMFEIYLLKRNGAEADYSEEQLTKAKALYESMNKEELKALSVRLLMFSLVVKWIFLCRIFVICLRNILKLIVKN